MNSTSTSGTSKMTSTSGGSGMVVGTSAASSSTSKMQWFAKDGAEDEEISEEVLYLRGVLLEKGDGVILKAWRKYFDPYCIGDVTFTKFCKGLTALGATGEDAVDLWKKLDSDGTNLLTLDEVDMDSFLMMEYCQKFCDKYGGAANMFQSVDYNRDGRLDRAEFGFAMKACGFCDDPECPPFLKTPEAVSTRLFPVCDISGDGSISLLELLFLERDVNKRKEIRDKLLKEIHERKYGKPKSMLAHYMLRDVTKATSTLDDYIAFMDSYMGSGTEGSAQAAELELLVRQRKPLWMGKLQSQGKYDRSWGDAENAKLEEFWKLESQIAQTKREGAIFKKKSAGTSKQLPPILQPKRGLDEEMVPCHDNTVKQKSSPQQVVDQNQAYKAPQSINQPNAPARSLPGTPQKRTLEKAKMIAAMSPKQGAASGTRKGPPPEIPVEGGGSDRGVSASEGPQSRPQTAPKSPSSTRRPRLARQPEEKGRKTGTLVDFETRPYPKPDPRTPRVDGEYPILNIRIVNGGGSVIDEGLSPHASASGMLSASAMKTKENPKEEMRMKKEQERAASPKTVFFVDPNKAKSTEDSPAGGVNRSQQSGGATATTKNNSKETPSSTAIPGSRPQTAHGRLQQPQAPRKKPPRKKRENVFSTETDTGRSLDNLERYSTGERRTLCVDMEAQRCRLRRLALDPWWPSEDDKFNKQMLMDTLGDMKSEDGDKNKKPDRTGMDSDRPTGFLLAKLGSAIDANFTGVDPDGVKNGEKDIQGKEEDRAKAAATARTTPKNGRPRSAGGESSQQASPSAAS
ncbi:unnamed protein product [Amoebophrya sp. A25]|nr:unnamed protein product [Amoebophrya sp. A25]|eukprot:GSA25T00016662001.1